MAALILGCGVLGLLFHAEVQAAVRVWLTSTAYGHCVLIAPMAAYLVWDRRAELAGLVARPVPWLPVLALPLAAAWLVAERLGIMEGRQLVAVAAVELLVLSVLGWRLFHAVLGPMLYLLFLVPFGAFATPWLQSVTAWIAIAGLDLIGIPNYSTDLTIEIPAGVFYVAEACAGLRFLIAAVAFGVFYALLTYRSTRRRCVFIATSIIVPIVANGLRALGIVVLGHVLGSAQAAAADHLVYGWVFFSFVILLLVAGGLPFREAPAAAKPLAGPVRPAAPPLALAGTALGVCLLVAAGPALAAALNRAGSAVLLTALPPFALPEGCVRGGDAPPLPASRATWTITCAGRSWEVSVQLFPTRSTAESLSSQRRQVGAEWEAEDTSVLPFSPGTPGAGTWRVVMTSHPDHLTATAAWVDGAPAVPGLTGRLQQARSSLLGSDHAPVLLALTTPLPGRLDEAQRGALLAELRRIVDAQPGLTGEIAALSRAGQ